MPSLPLSHHSFPLLSSASTGMPLQWNHGPMYNVLLTSRYVRISELGIQWCVLCGKTALHSSASDMQILQILSSTHGWSSSLPCTPCHDAFCSISKIGESAITLFPTSRVHVSLAPNVFVEAVHECHSQTANRNIATMDSGYQVSLCDIVDSKLDFVLDVDSATVYWRRDDKPLLWSLCVTLSSLFFFTRVCEHLALLVRGERRPFSEFTTVAIISMLLLCRCLLATGVLSQHLVTHEELMLNLILEFYCYLYIIAEFTVTDTFTSACNRLWATCSRRQATQTRKNEIYAEIPQAIPQIPQAIPCTLGTGKNDGRHDIGTLGSLLAVQLILTAHLQNTFENPFLGILTLLFGTRAFLKFMNFMLVHTTCERSTDNDRTIASKLFFLSVDTVTLACVFELAVRTSARSEAEYASTATGMLIIIVLGGAFLHGVIRSWSSCRGRLSAKY